MTTNFDSIPPIKPMLATPIDKSEAVRRVSLSKKFAPLYAINNLGLIFLALSALNWIVGFIKAIPTMCNRTDEFVLTNDFILALEFPCFKIALTLLLLYLFLYAFLSLTSIPFRDSDFWLPNDKYAELDKLCRTYPQINLYRNQVVAQRRQLLLSELKLAKQWSKALNQYLAESHTYKKQNLC